jgi:hypothetical protein
LRADPDHPAAQHQRDGHQAGGDDLPVALAASQISVTPVLFLPRGGNSDPFQRFPNTH